MDIKPLNGFIGQALMDLMPKNVLGNNMDIWNVIFSCIDYIFLGALILGIVFMIYQGIKFGIRKMKINHNEVAREETINWRKDLQSAFKGFFFITILPWVAVAIFAIIISIMGANS